ncbi:hypothetical protein LLH00_04785 [bacterium]|nr:hypothetical protein [bacterium]
MQRRQFVRRNLALAAAAPFISPLSAGAVEAGSQPESFSAAHPSGRPLRLGLVQLDTSHPDSISAALKERTDIQIAAVFDRGLVYGPERTAAYAADNGVKHVCKTLEEMVPLVDVAMVLGVDWDNHVSDAEPFIRAGVPVFIDKPVVGCEADARRLLELRTKYLTPVFGGSTYRYNEAFLALKEKMSHLEDKVALTVYGKINSHSRNDMLDLMYYGIHGVETMSEVLGPGALTVNYLDFYRKQHLIHVHYDNRPPVMLVLGWALSNTQAVLLTDTAVENVEPTVNEGLIYPRIMAGMARSIVDRREDRPVDETLEACRVLIAAQKSRTLGRPVTLSELEPGDGFDGDEFALEYRRFRNLSSDERHNWREGER